MKIPRVTSDKIVKALQKKGFVLARQSGSHMIFRNEKGVRVTVPHHSGAIIHPKILKRIIDDAELSPENF